MLEAETSKTIIVNKSVFCINNIDCNYSEDDVRDYIKSIGVRLLTCFELHSANRTISDRKAFRVCIVSEDKSILLDANQWSVGVTIRDWIRRTRNADDASGGTVQPQTAKSSASTSRESCESSNVTSLSGPSYEPNAAKNSQELSNHPGATGLGSSAQDIPASLEQLDERSDMEGITHHA